MVAIDTEIVALVVDDDNVYYARGGVDPAIMRAPIAGPAPMKTLTVLAKTPKSRGIASDDQYIFFTDETDGTVNAVRKSGGPVRVIASGLSIPHAIAVDATSIYWTNLGDGTVMKTAK